MKINYWLLAFIWLIAWSTIPTAIGTYHLNQYNAYAPEAEVKLITITEVIGGLISIGPLAFLVFKDALVTNEQKESTQ